MEATQIFLDSEFTELKQCSKLISLALIAMSGETFYAEFNDYDISKCNPWIRENVISRLKFNSIESGIFREGYSYSIKGNTKEILDSLKIWLRNFEIIEIWADVSAYDWVLFCELFGGAKQVPDNIFFAPFDISTFFRIMNFIIPQGNYKGDIDRYDFAGHGHKWQHNALDDAMVSMECYKKLNGLWKKNL